MITSSVTTLPLVLNENLVVESGKPFIYQNKLEVIAVKPQAEDKRREFFWDASQYVDCASLQEQWNNRFFFNNYLWNGNEKVLDIGCGDGKLTAQIVKRLPKGSVLGIDNSSSMIKHAQEFYPPNTYPNLTFVLADAADRVFFQGRNDQFDLIVSFHCLHWLDDQIDILKGIRHVLKEGGKAYLLFSSDGPLTIKEAANRVAANDRWKQLFKDFQDPHHCFSEEKYLTFLCNAELKPIRIKNVTVEFKLTSNELIQNAKSWLPHVKYLSKPLQQPFLEDLVEECKKMMPSGNDESICVYESNLEVEAQR